MRWTLRRGLLAKPLFGGALALGRAMKGVLPQALRAQLPDAAPAGAWPAPRHARKMLVLEGCVQPSLAPNIDAAMARILDRIGISLVQAGGGGLLRRAAAPPRARPTQAVAIAKRNIDAWWPHLDRDVEAVVVTASGCGVMVKDYGHLLRTTPPTPRRRAASPTRAKDPVEVIGAEWKAIAPKVAMDFGPQRVAFHPPCTLQHGMKLKGRVEEILLALGLELTPVADAHLCCGSAGTYSILQPELSGRLKANKLAALEAGEPDVIASANIGCLDASRERHAAPVRHWIELLDARMIGGTRRRRGRRPGVGMTAMRQGRRNERRRARAAPLPRGAYRHFLAIPTRWMDNDSYGHVNNVTYYSYFDTAVNEHLIRAGGLDIADGAGGRLRRRDACRFHAVADVSRHCSTSGLRVARLGTSSVTYEIGIFRRGDDAPAASGRFVHVWVDRATQRPTPVPPRIRAALLPLVVPAAG